MYKTQTLGNSPTLRTMNIAYASLDPSYLNALYRNSSPLEKNASTNCKNKVETNRKDYWVYMCENEHAEYEIGDDEGVQLCWL